LTGTPLNGYHSPYFVDIQAIVNGAKLVRVRNNGAGIRIFAIKSPTVESIRRLALENLYNHHTFGLNARELFFLEDKVILVEGQEDVLLYPDVAKQVGLSFDGEFFGWEVGGAQNMPKICSVLKELGFERVAGLLDLHQQGEIEKLHSEFPEYVFDCIPADDIRTKVTPECGRRADGLLDANRQLQNQHREQVKSLITRVNVYLNG
jgi:hypothetical protein